MIELRRNIVFLVLLSAASVAHAIEVKGQGYFEKLITGSQKTVPATQASLADKVSYTFLLTTSSGEHPLLIVIYDGSGREVFKSQSTITVRTGPAGRSITYGYDRVRDAPGTWWYVVHLDSQVVLSNSIEVVP